MTIEEIWTLLVSAQSDFRCRDQVFQHTASSLYLDGFKVVRDLNPLLPFATDGTAASYITRIAETTGCRPVLLLGGMQTASWSLIDALAPFLERIQQQHGDVGVTVWLVLGHLDDALHHLDESQGKSVCYMFNESGKEANLERFHISSNDQRYHHSDVRTWLVLRLSTATNEDRYNDINTVFSGVCSVALSSSDHSSSAQATTLALAIEQASDTENLTHQLSALRLCKRSAHGLERTPGLKVGTVPGNALLSKKSHSRIDWVSPNLANNSTNTLLLSAWGHYFGISPKPNWLEPFLRALSLSNSTRFDNLCSAVNVTDRLLAKELVNALWSANALEFRGDPL